MSPSSENGDNSTRYFQPVSDPLSLESILTKRLPISCNVYNMMRIHKRWEGHTSWFTLYDPSVDDVWVVATFVRKDYGRTVCVSRPPTAQITPKVRSAFSNCDFMDWNESFNFTASEPIVASMVVDISIMDKGNWTQVHPNYLYIFREEDAAKIQIEKSEEFELKRIQNKEGEDFLVHNWRYRNKNTHDYVEKSLERNLSTGLYVDGNIVAGALVGPEGLTGMLYTSEKFRGKGYAKIVMQQLSKQAMEQRLVPCSCAEVKNEASNAMHLKFGATSLGQANYVKFVKTGF